MTTTSEIIEKFNLQVDDASELSDAEELALANEVYTDVQNDRDWEWLKSSYTGTTSTTLPYIDLPTDFRKMAMNKDNRTVVFVGDDYSEYEVVSFADRRNYRDEDGFCYLDMVNKRLYFTLQPTSAKAVEYDYIIVAPELDELGATPTGSNPLFRTSFYPIISYGMAMKFPSIEQAAKDTSYAKENEAEFYRILSDMREEDANIKLSL